MLSLTRLYKSVTGGWKSEVLTMGSDAIKLAVELIVTCLLISVSIICVRTAKEPTRSATAQINGIVQQADNELLKSMNGRFSDGASVKAMLGSYINDVPVLLVTGVLNEESTKYSYAVNKVYDSSAPEYLNPAYNYYVDAGFDTEGQVIWIRVVQSDVVDSVGLNNVADIKSTIDDYSSEFSRCGKRTQLLQKQYELYKKNNS